MKYIATINFFDGFECDFNQDLVFDGDSAEEVETYVRNHFEEQKKLKPNARPYFVDVTVQSLEHWIESHRAEF